MSEVRISVAGAGLIGRWHIGDDAGQHRVIGLFATTAATARSCSRRVRSSKAALRDGLPASPERPCSRRPTTTGRPVDITN